MKNVQEFCKDFRINYLKLTLQEIQDTYGIPFKALSALENGRSTNIQHLNTYYLLCKNRKDRKCFIDGFDKAMDKDRLEGYKWKAL